MVTPNPLLITLAIDTKAQLFFNYLRQQHFPPDRNYLDAHLMLFHNLPAGENAITNQLKVLAENTQQFALDITDVVCIGRGVAYKAVSTQLSLMHTQLQKNWKEWLIPQDQQKLWPHITVQNKVEHHTAQALARQLADDFEPFEITGTGLQLWEYQGGPWQFIRAYDFKP